MAEGRLASLPLEATDEGFEIDLVEDPRVEAGPCTADLIVMDDLNPGMVVVAIGRQVVGAVPAELASAWHDYVTRCMAEGRVPEADAEVSIDNGAVSVVLYADAGASYRTPGEEAAERGARGRRRVERLLARSAGACRDCGNPVEPTGKRGRPPARCAACRAGETVPLAPRTPAPLWLREPAWSDWSVIDLETTGLWPSVDRVVEIGVVRLSRDGDEVASWTTLVDPDRDVGASEIHGLTAYDLRGAPRFGELAPSLLALLAGTRLAAHNARFDTDFLSAELARAGIDWGTPDALCTMNAASRLRLTSSRSLSGCCSELGIPLGEAHCAIDDARAAARIAARIIPILDTPVSVVPPLRDGPLPPPSRARTDPPPPRLDTALGALADRIGVPDDLDAPPEAAAAYLALLDRVLEDRRVTDHEVGALAAVASEWGLCAGAVRALHAAYLGGVWDLARADGIITPAEDRDLAILAELLGVDLEGASGPPAVVPACPHEDLRGKSVCFTGASVVTIDGECLRRSDQEALAAREGLVVKGNVSGRLDILVLADPDSRSGKSKLADDLGVRKIAEPVFWRMLGVAID